MVRDARACRPCCAHCEESKSSMSGGFCSVGGVSRSNTQQRWYIQFSISGSRAVGIIWADQSIRVGVQGVSTSFVTIFYSRLQFDFSFGSVGLGDQEQDPFGSRLLLVRELSHHW